MRFHRVTWQLKHLGPLHESVAVLLFVIPFSEFYPRCRVNSFIYVLLSLTRQLYFYEKKDLRLKKTAGVWRDFLCVHNTTEQAAMFLIGFKLSPVRAGVVILILKQWCSPINLSLTLLPVFCFCIRGVKCTRGKFTFPISIKPSSYRKLAIKPANSSKSMSDKFKEKLIYIRSHIWNVKCTRASFHLDKFSSTRFLFAASCGREKMASFSLATCFVEKLTCQLLKKGDLTRKNWRT